MEGQELTALLDSDTQASDISHQLCLDFCLENQFLGNLIQLQGIGGHQLEYLGCIEASLSLQGSSLKSKVFLMPSIPYLHRVPVSLRTNVSDLILQSSSQYELPKTLQT